MRRVARCVGEGGASRWDADECEGAQGVPLDTPCSKTDGATELLNYSTPVADDPGLPMELGSQECQRLE